MLVKELRELLEKAPQDLVVLVKIDDLLHPGMFAFAEACSCETGVVTIGTTEGEREVFLVLPHGAGVAGSEIKEIMPPEMN